MNIPDIQINAPNIKRTLAGCDMILSISESTINKHFAKMQNEFIKDSQSSKNQHQQTPEYYGIGKKIVIVNYKSEPEFDKELYSNEAEFKEDKEFYTREYKRIKDRVSSDPNEIDWLNEEISKRPELNSIIDSVVIMDEMVSPRINITEGSQKLLEVIFQFNKVCVTTFNVRVTGGKVKVSSKDIKGTWTYAFNCKIDSIIPSEKFLNHDPQTKKAITEITAGEMEALFTIEALFLDLENANYLEYNERKTIFEVDDKSSTLQSIEQEKIKLIMAVREHFSKLKGKNNPYILGYKVTVNSFDQAKKALLHPTDIKYSTIYCNPDETKYPRTEYGSTGSAFNFLMLVGEKFTDPVHINNQALGYITHTLIRAKGVNTTNVGDAAIAIDYVTFYNKFLSKNVFTCILESLGATIKNKVQDANEALITEIINTQSGFKTTITQKPRDSLARGSHYSKDSAYGAELTKILKDFFESVEEGIFCRDLKELTLTQIITDINYDIAVDLEQNKDHTISIKVKLTLKINHTVGIRAVHDHLLSTKEIQDLELNTNFTREILLNFEILPGKQGRIQFGKLKAHLGDKTSSGRFTKGGWRTADISSFLTVNEKYIDQEFTALQEAILGNDFANKLQKELTDRLKPVANCIILPGGKVLSYKDIDFMNPFPAQNADNAFVLQATYNPVDE